uniref:ABC transporter permease n=1 Tax=Rhizobium rhizogenes TaxID=359 RepID=UPI00155D87BE|nr:ABC transporter permease [Rhizobium rhizogenes]
MALQDLPRELVQNASGPGAGEFVPVEDRRPSVLRALLRQPGAVIGLVVLLLIVLMAILAPWLAPEDPLDMVGSPLLHPGEAPAFPFGTDMMGRDVFAGIVHGARVSLTVGLAATALSVTGGVLIGAIGGYFGGRVDDLVVRFIEIFQTIPGFVLLVVLVAVAQPSIGTVVVGIAVISWDGIARLARAEFRTLRQADFVTAARSSGFGSVDIIFREILPNALPSLIVTASIMVASAILQESALAFLGLGDPNTVSWGSMIGAGREMLRTHAYLTAIPGGFIVLTVLSLNLIGDGLNDILNPKLRNG